MKAQLIKIAGQLVKLGERAEVLADSDNEETAARYEQVIECITAALEPLDEAIELWN